MIIQKKIIEQTKQHIISVNMRNLSLIRLVLLILLFLFNDFHAVAGPTAVKRVKVGEEFTLTASQHSNTQNIAWHWETEYFELVSNIGTVTPSVTFRAKKANTQYGFQDIEAITYYLENGTTSTGSMRDKCLWHITISDGNDNGGDNNGGNTGGDGGFTEGADLVYFDDTDITVYKGGTSKIITANTKEPGGIFEWSIVNTNIAAVTPKEYSERYAEVYGKSIGDTKLRVAYRTSTSNSYAWMNIHVVDPDPVSVSLNHRSSYLIPGQKSKLYASVYPEWSIYNLTWSSSDESVVSVDKSGNLVAKKLGESTITVSTGNGKSDYCDIYVIEGTSSEVIETFPETGGIINSLSPIAVGFKENIEMVEGVGTNCFILHTSSGSYYNKPYIKDNTLYLILPKKFIIHGDCILEVKPGTFRLKESGELNSPILFRFKVDANNYAIDLGGSAVNSWIIKNDNTLWEWGNYSSRVYSPRKIESDIVATASASHIGYNSFIVKKDHTLWGYGYNSNGELGLGHSNQVYDWTKINENVESVAYSGHTLILKNDGTLWGCGINNTNQLGISTGKLAEKNLVRINLANVSKIYADHNTSAAITTDGSLYLWGSNYGIYNYPTPTKVFNDVAHVRFCLNGVYVVTTDHKLYELFPESQKRLSPQLIESNVKYIDFKSKIYTNDKLFVWGNNKYGFFGNGTKGSMSRTIDNAIYVMSDVARSFSNRDYQENITCLKDDGSVWVWGSNSKYFLGSNDTSLEYLTPHMLWPGKGNDVFGKLEFKNEVVYMRRGQSYVNPLVLLPTDYPIKEIIYSSKDTNVASVSDEGLVSANNDGTTNVILKIVGDDDSVHECSYTIVVGDEEDAITQPKDEHNPLFDNIYYDLSGRMHETVQPGINIFKTRDGQWKKILK